MKLSTLALLPCLTAGLLCGALPAQARVARIASEAAAVAARLCN